MNSPTVTGITGTTMPENINVTIAAQVVRRLTHGRVTFAEPHSGHAAAVNSGRCPIDRWSANSAA
jgi:hypothetical protein